jgi:prepilin-type N-terminal cleavage/methylation domain-containing protein
MKAAAAKPSPDQPPVGLRALAGLACDRRPDTRCRTLAFTLVEMMLVVALVAVLSALTLPALQGLLGTSGVRGGVNTVLATLDQARAAAIENGADVYVGFPPSDFFDPHDPATAFSSLIVFRGPRPDEPSTSYIPISRWVRLPSGIAMQAENMTFTNIDVSVAAFLPKLAGQRVEPVVIAYDRFGRVRTPVSGATNLTVGEAVVSGGIVDWKGNNREFLTAQRLTGRWLVTEP